MTPWLRVAVLLLAAAPLVGATSEVQEQTVTPLTPPAEQRVEPLAPQGEQRVEAVDADGTQQVSGGTKNPAARAASAVGKVVLGVTAAAVSIGIMVASLLLL